MEGGLFMKRFFSLMLASLMLIGICSCGQKREYTEEQQRIIDALYNLKTAGENMQKHYNGLDEENQKLMLGVTKALYQANAREYDSAISLLQMTSVVLPEDLPDTLPDFQE